VGVVFILLNLAAMNLRFGQILMPNKSLKHDGKNAIAFPAS